MRVVIDANVYASALMKPEGTPGLVLSYIFSQEDIVVIGTQSILEEITKILYYPKVRMRILLDDHQLDCWIAALETALDIVIPQEYAALSPIIEEDPDDDQYIFAAIEVKADYIISGDKHLLRLNNYMKHKIVTPAEFYSREISKITI